VPKETGYQSANRNAGSVMSN